MPGTRPGMTQITTDVALEATLALHQHRAGALRALALVHDPEAFGHFGIGLEQAAEIAAEAVLVELVVGLDVPQPAAVGGNLVRDHNAHHVVFPEPARFHLEVDQTDTDAEEKPGEEIVEADGERHDVVGLLRRSPEEGRDGLFQHHRVVELVVLVVELDDRARQLCAFLDADALRQGPCGDIAHDNFERNDLHLSNQLLAHVETADEVGRYPDIVEVLEHIFRDSIVEHALAFDHLVLFGVEGGRVVLEMLNQRSRLGAFIKDLRLALVNATAAAHGRVPWFVKVHRIAVAPYCATMQIRGCGTGLEALALASVRARIQPSRSVGAAQSRNAYVFHSVFSP